MSALLQNSWTAAVIGILLYCATTASLLLKAKATLRPPEPTFREDSNITGPAWAFHNPELDQLVSELRKEKEALGVREAQLKEMEARLALEREEINQITLSVNKLQQEFDKNVVRVQEAETANLKRLAKMYANMEPSSAAIILKELENNTVVKSLRFMKESESAPILEHIAKQGEADAKRAAEIADKLRVSINEPAKP